MDTFYEGRNKHAGVYTFNTIYSVATSREEVGANDLDTSQTLNIISGSNKTWSLDLQTAT